MDFRVVTFIFAVEAVVVAILMEWYKNDIRKKRAEALELTGVSSALCAILAFLAYKGIPHGGYGWTVAVIYGMLLFCAQFTLDMALLKKLANAYIRAKGFNVEI